MGDLKRKRGRKPKNAVSDSGGGAETAMDEGVVSANPIETATNGDTQTHRRGRGRLRKVEEVVDRDIAASPERRGHRFADHKNDELTATILSGD